MSTSQRWPSRGRRVEKEVERMAREEITCPKCGERIPLTEAIKHTIREEMEKDFLKELEGKEAEMAKLRESQAREMEAAEERHRKRVEGLREELASKARLEASKEFRAQVKELREELKETSGRLEKAEDREIELRKRAKDLERREKRMELEMERRMDEEREHISKEAQRDVEERLGHDLAMRDKKIELMQRTIEELRQRSLQGSQKVQGEVTEADVRGKLEEAFGDDDVEKVPGGRRGADIIQTIRSRNGMECGRILWEVKRARNWSDGWVKKLKDDQRRTKADVAVIVSSVLPKDVDDFGYVDKVLVTSYRAAVPAAALVRQRLIDIASTKRASEDLDLKMKLLYDYLYSPEFHQTIEVMWEALEDMRAVMDRERRSYESMWAEREQQIQRAQLGIIQMYGGFKGAVGKSLPDIEVLRLPEPPEGGE